MFYRRSRTWALRDFDQFVLGGGGGVNRPFSVTMYRAVYRPGMHHPGLCTCQPVQMTGGHVKSYLRVYAGVI